jgi:hypothetical protein
MAAGDVTIHKSTGRGLRGMRQVMGVVQLDGSNPTPIALAGYLGTVQGCVVTLVGSAAPGDDAFTFSYTVSGTTVSLYAWMFISGTDPTLVASTNNALSVAFMAWGTA